MVVGLALACVACQPTGSPRCDQQLGVQATVIELNGGVLRCDPSYDKDEPATATHVMQWNRGKPIWWLWADTRFPQRIDDYWLEVDGWVGVYELQAFHDGRVPDFYISVQKWGVPVDVEADAYRWAVQQMR